MSHFGPHDVCFRELLTPRAMARLGRQRTVCFSSGQSPKRTSCFRPDPATWPNAYERLSWVDFCRSASGSQSGRRGHPAMRAYKLRRPSSAAPRLDLDNYRSGYTALRGG